MFTQCIAKHLPGIPAESEGAEETGLTRAVAVIQIEQIIEDLFSFDQQQLSSGKHHVRLLYWTAAEQRSAFKVRPLSASIHLATNSSKL